MKNFIKTVIAASLLLAGMGLQAVTPETIAKLDTEREAREKAERETFPQFVQLPKDVQEQIILAINEGSTPLDSAKKLGQLRRVSKQMKNFIESPYIGKQLMQNIADRFPGNIKELLDSALALNTPGSIAWVNEHAAWIKEQLSLGTIDNVAFNQFLMDLMRLPRTPEGIAQLLLLLVDDPNYVVNPLSDSTILEVAARTGNIQLITDLLNAGADINRIGEYEVHEQIRRHTALDTPHINQKTIDLLRSRGGKTAAELDQGQ